MSEIILFDPGRVVMTPGAMDAIVRAGQKPSEFVLPHCRLEVGELDAGDHKANLRAMKTGLRVFSSFKTHAGEGLWVISEAVDIEHGGKPKRRELTTLLLPEEY